MAQHPGSSYTPENNQHNRERGRAYSKGQHHGTQGPARQAISCHTEPVNSTPAGRADHAAGAAAAWWPGGWRWLSRATRKASRVAGITSNTSNTKHPPFPLRSKRCICKWWPTAAAVTADSCILFGFKALAPNHTILRSSQTKHTYQPHTAEMHCRVYPAGTTRPCTAAHMCAGVSHHTAMVHATTAKQHAGHQPRRTAPRPRGNQRKTAGSCCHSQPTRCEHSSNAARCVVQDT